MAIIKECRGSVLCLFLWYGNMGKDGKHYSDRTGNRQKDTKSRGEALNGRFGERDCTSI